VATRQPAAGGGRWVEVRHDRVAAWLAGFDARHRVVRSLYGDATVRFEAADRAVAECHPPFPPPPPKGTHEGFVPGPLVVLVQRDRVVAVLLVRLGGHAVGVFEGDRLVASKVGSRLVHGRNAAGGWSQHRFQRRREGQARQAATAAADDAARVIGPRLPTLEAAVLGGDRRAVAALREDPRLASVFTLAVDRFLTTPDPKLAVLLRSPEAFRALRVRLLDPP
jgi:hypothetical protein